MKGKDIIGKIVITLDKGKEVEKVYDLIFDQSTNSVLGFLVDQGGWFSDARVLPITNIKTIGPDAVIIENEAAIISASDNPPMKAVLEAENTLKGTKVMTEDAKDLGTMIDLYFDEKTGKVEGYEVSGGLFADAYQGRAMVPAPDTISIGEDVAFVPSHTAHLMQAQTGGIKAAMQNAGDKLQEVKERATEKGQELAASAGQKTDDLKSTVTTQAESLKNKATDPATKAKVQDTSEQVKQQAAEFWQYVKEKAAMLKDQGDQKMEEMKINAALGRPVNRVIFDKQDQIILNVGDVITHSAIERSREAGVLPILLTSVYKQEPQFTPQEMQQKAANAPRP